MCFRRLRTATMISLARAASSPEPTKLISRFQTFSRDIAHPVSREKGRPKPPLSRVLSSVRALVVLRRALRLVLRAGLRAALEMPGVAGVRVVPERGAGGDSRERKRARQGDSRDLTTHLAHSSFSSSLARHTGYTATAGRDG